MGKPVCASLELRRGSGLADQRANRPNRQTEFWMGIRYWGLGIRRRQTSPYSQQLPSTQYPIPNTWNRQTGPRPNRPTDHV